MTALALALVSHGVNVVVLLLVLRGLAAGDAAMDGAYGPDTPARRILACLYLAILLASLAALVSAAFAKLEGEAFAAFAWASVALFAVQVVYKVATAAAVGLANPVVVANLAIAALHAVTAGALVARLARGG